MAKKNSKADQAKLFDVPESQPVFKVPKVESFQQFLTRQARAGIKMMREAFQEEKDREYIESLGKKSNKNATERTDNKA